MTERLREEDLVVGKAFVHPETKLEYRDYHAWFVGEAPLPHWRNYHVKELTRLWGTPEWLQEEKSLEARIARLFREYDRQGNLYAHVHQYDCGRPEDGPGPFAYQLA